MKKAPSVTEAQSHRDSIFKNDLYNLYNINLEILILLNVQENKITLETTKRFVSSIYTKNMFDQKIHFRP